MKPLSVLGSAALIVAFTLCLSHSLDDYGFLKNSLIGEVLAQSGSTGSTTGGTTGDGNSTEPKKCISRTASHDYTTDVCYGLHDDGMTGTVYRSSSSYTLTCERPKNELKSSCQAGTITTVYVMDKYNCIEVDRYTTGSVITVDCGGERTNR